MSWGCRGVGVVVGAEPYCSQHPVPFELTGRVHGLVDRGLEGFEIVGLATRLLRHGRPPCRTAAVDLRRSAHPGGADRRDARRMQLPGRARSAHLTLPAPGLRLM